jgi:hypothetical protein
MDKIALIIIYNHRYDKNIPILEEIYGGKFSNIYHVIPFYDGELKNVIPVYESSLFFSGYISQAYSHLQDKGFTHFFCVADDMLVNPSINEKNIFDKLLIDKDEAYIDELKSLTKKEKYWPHLYNALCYNPNQLGVEIKNILPAKSRAIMLMSNLGLKCDSLPLLDFVSFLLKKMFYDLYFAFRRKNIKRFFGGEKEFPTPNFRYPLVGGYSDILLVPNLVMENFSKYCGAFAASNLFVEIAIPSALALASPKIKTNEDIILKSGVMWTKAEKDELSLIYKNSLFGLLNDFPIEKLYLHPIKLSQWK